MLVVSLMLLRGTSLRRSFLPSRRLSRAMALVGPLRLFEGYLLRLIDAPVQILGGQLDRRVEVCVVEAPVVASEEGHETLVEYLSNGGADCRAVTKAGKTALYNACERGHVNIASMLLEGGSDPSQQTCRKKIALYTAAEQGNVELVKLLLPFTKKADLFVETTYGTTPLFIATKSGSAEVKDLLVAFCSRGEKPKRKMVTASLAKAPSTPRFRKDAEAHAKREKDLKKKEQRRLNALRRKEELEMAENARKEERRRNFEEKHENLPDGYNDSNGGVGRPWRKPIYLKQIGKPTTRIVKRRRTNSGRET